ncbi:glycoside hydrolase family 13 protein [Amycolatopsis cynarae]|uniref:Glycoside hydrolase family 13 protein n=1 Tax=Amycolatopsis cynarae TaxID=2995223 RepID=A0ABY7BAC5_9PSEU|nr:glycoside hydrolase family 13 protein [Amycolatopsis sp. HUAS 11-8]WAL68182.1 glycoside hydrolase family 13 protein [Amycolatopsis sp. HUAS 11-8]
MTTTRSGHQPGRGEWWRTAAIYQIYIRSFADGNGDGNGDLAGIRSRLGYLAGLGVDAVWITPFYPSPLADGGYDVADYRDVDPMFGDIGEFKALLGEAHARGLRVIIDLVPNHTSSRHQWFQEALAGEPGARERYLFRDGNGDQPPNDWESVFGGPAWTRVADGQWYLHLFDPAQPDLNWDNVEVRAEFEEILRFWLDLGVDGIRIDVAHGMVKAHGLPDTGRTRQIELLGQAELPYFDQDGVHEIYRAWRKILDSYPGERMAVAEAWAPNAERLAHYLRPDELHQAFNFHYVKAGWDAGQFRQVIDESLAAVAEVDAPATWVLSNHDIVRHVTRLGGVRRARAAALLTLALPGSAYLYQGEELSLPEVTDLPEEVLADPMWERSGHTERGRDGCRVPIPWSGKASPFGFSTSAPWLPQPESWSELTVEAQESEEDSTLSLYRKALRLRRSVTGEFAWLEAPEGVLGFRRGRDFVCTVNFTGEAVDLGLPHRPVLSSVPLDGGLLPPHSAVWWQAREQRRAEGEDTMP